MPALCSTAAGRLGDVAEVGFWPGLPVRQTRLKRSLAKGDRAEAQLLGTAANWCSRAKTGRTRPGQNSNQNDRTNMDAANFVKNWSDLRAELLGAFMGDHGHAEVAKRVEAMGLTAAQMTQLRVVLDGALRDTMYTLLLGLDGAASIGRDQQTFRIHDEDGTSSPPAASLKKRLGRSSTAPHE